MENRLTVLMPAEGASATTIPEGFSIKPIALMLAFVEMTSLRPSAKAKERLSVCPHGL